MREFNLYGDEWDERRDRDGWRIKEAFVGQRIGGRLIGASLCEIEPGSKLWPYHTHHANEEWVIVLRGEPTLRAPEGERTLRQGDVVCFPRGPEGAHQLINRTASAVRALMLSTAIQPDVVEYLDTGRILAHDANGGYIMFAQPGPPSDYWDGED